MTGRHPRVVASVAIAVLVITWGFLGYRWIDTAISLDYALQERGLQAQRIDILQQLLRLTAGRSSRTQILNALRERSGKLHVIREEGSRILVDDVALHFEGEVLVGVKFEASGE